MHPRRQRASVTPARYGSPREARMEWREDTKTLELTARNVNALTAKLDDPKSARMITAPGDTVTVRAAEAATPAETRAGVVEGIVTVILHPEGA